MRSYLLPIVCPHCAGEMDHVNGTTNAGTEAVGMTKCSQCSREFAVLVHLRQVAAAVDRRVSA